MKNTEKLCEFLSGLDRSCVPDAIWADIQYKTLDWLGCALGALGTKSAQGMLAFARKTGGSPQCTAIGLSKKTSMQNAVFSNGVLGHVLEYDDVNKVAITHPGAVVIPAALAAAERSSSTYQTYALGIVAGYEMMIRLGAVLNPSHYEHWHTTGTCGAFAAAAAAARIRGLSGVQMEQAMGIAATMASGLSSVFGTDAKLVTVGNAAYNGVTAAELAAEGFTAPCGIVEREKGYASAVSRQTDFSGMLPKPGEPLMISDAYYKIHASCGHTHSALDAMRALMDEFQFSPDEIVHILVRVYGVAQELTGVFRNDDEARAKFSLPFCIASMALYGRVTLKEFAPVLLRAPEMLAMKEKIEIREEPEFTARYPSRRVQSVSVQLTSRTVEKTVELPQGKPSAEFLRRKFLSLASMSLSESGAQQMMDCTLRLTEQSAMAEFGNQIRRTISNGQ